MAATGVFRGVVTRNDSSGVWVSITHANGVFAGNMAAPCLVAPGVITTVGSPVIVSFEQNIRNYPVIVGNYGSIYVQPGYVLNQVQYAPSSLVTYNLTSSVAAVDTTNLRIGFAAPVSGSVTMEASIFGQSVAAASVGYTTALAIGFVHHGTSTLATPAKRFAQTWTTAAGESSQLGVTCEYRTLVGGLTPGASYTYDLAAFFNSSPSIAGAAAAKLYADNGQPSSFLPTGPAVLTAIAA